MTIPLPANGAGPVVAGARPPAPVSHRRGRRVATLSAAALAVLAAAGIAVWLGLGRPGLLRAGHRAPSASAPHAPMTAGSGGTDLSSTPLPRREDILEEVTPVPEPPPRTARTPQRPSASAVRPERPKPLRVTVPAGTSLEVALESAVGSSTSRVGDAVTVTVSRPVTNGTRVPIPAGARLRGTVSDVTPARKGLKDKGGSITLSFDRLVTADGGALPIAASLTRSESGGGGKTAGAIGGGAAGGAILGKVLGHGSKDAAIGSVLGAAIGTGVAAGTRGKDVTLAAGSPLTLVLERPLTVSIAP